MTRFGLPIIATVIAIPVIATPVWASNSIEIREWEVPYEYTRPRDPDTTDGKLIWFVGQGGDYLGRFDVATEAFHKVDLEPGVGPHNLIVDTHGAVWFAGNRKGYIGRYDPESGEIEKIAMPIKAARDPHTLVFDKAGDIWFTVQGGNYVGKLTVRDRRVDLVAVPTGRARPYGIVVAPDGTPWIALFGTNKLASVDPETLVMSEHVIPRNDARPRRLVVTADGRVWYGDYAGGILGAFDPANGSYREWPLPSGENASPYAMAADSQDRIWLVETGSSPNLFVGFDPIIESFFSVTPLPSGGGTVRHMTYDRATGTIWFGADTNTIGRAQVE